MKIDELYPKDREQKINGRKRVMAPDGAYVIVAAWGNPLHLRAINRARKGRESEIDDPKNPIPIEVEDRLDCQAMAEGVLRGWGKFEENGHEVPYSVETATDWLFDRVGFRLEVVKYAQEEAALSRRDEEEAGKGSRRGSSAKGTAPRSR